MYPFFRLQFAAFIRTINHTSSRAYRCGSHESITLIRNVHSEIQCFISVYINIYIYLYITTTIPLNTLNKHSQSVLNTSLYVVNLCCWSFFFWVYYTIMQLNVWGAANAGLLIVFSNANANFHGAGKQKLEFAVRFRLGLMISIFYEVFLALWGLLLSVNTDFFGLFKCSNDSIWKLKMWKILKKIQLF